MVDLWAEEGGTKAVHRPRDVRTSSTWTLPPEAVPLIPDAPRRRKIEHVKPNKRAAVAVPLEGQSYNPTDSSHQEALKVAVKKLEKKKRQHQKLVELLSIGRTEGVQGNFSADKTWDEEVKEVKPAKPMTAEKLESKKRKQLERKKKNKKKGGKKNAADMAKRAMQHRQHPDRTAPLKQIDEIDEIAVEVQKKVAKRERTAIEKKKARKEGQQIKTFGRYHHTPLVVDVAPTDKLVGSLRHMSGSYVHPALDRIKSLEERNMIPARMRHVFNKRKLLKPKGEVRIKRETVGCLPETSH